MADRIGAKGLTLQQLTSIIDQLQRRFDGSQAPGTMARALARPSSLHGLMKWRRDHYHNLAAAAPLLPEPYNDGPRFQSDHPRQLHVQAKARVLENPFVIRIEPPRKTAGWRRTADDAEKVLNTGIDGVAEKLGIDIMGALYDGIGIDAFGVLHWRVDPKAVPGIGDAEYRDSLPEEEDEAKRYEPDSGTRGYRQTEEDRQEQHNIAKARAGLPLIIDVIDPHAIYFILDKGFEGGVGMVAHIREVPLLDYNQALLGEAVVAIAGEGLRIYEERPGPEQWQPSSVTGYEHNVVVASIWTRDEYYELASASRGAAGYQVVKSFKHHYGMPPFALAIGNDNSSPDPALRYEPFLEGVFRVKELFDREMAFYLVLTEMVAVPYYYVRTAEGAYQLDADGNRLMFTRDSLSAQRLPAGAELVKVEYQINEAFIKGLEFLKAEMQGAAPATGRGEISATTQPWTARIQQAQESLEPAMAVRSIQRAIRVMVRNVVRCLARSAEEGGPGEDVYVLVDGEPAGIEAAKWAELVHGIQVDINPHSAAERITIVEHMKGLLGDPAVPFLERKFVEEGLGELDATEFLNEVTAERVYKQFVEPKVIAAVLLEEFGQLVFMGPDGQDYDFQGQPIPTAELARRNGMNAPPELTQTEMPGMPPLAPPAAAGAMPIQ